MCGGHYHTLLFGHCLPQNVGDYPGSRQLSPPLTANHLRFQHWTLPQIVCDDLLLHMKVGDYPGSRQLLAPTRSAG